MNCGLITNVTMSCSFIQVGVVSIMKKWTILNLHNQYIKYFEDKKNVKKYLANEEAKADSGTWGPHKGKRPLHLVLAFCSMADSHSSRPLCSLKAAIWQSTWTKLKWVTVEYPGVRRSPGKPGGGTSPKNQILKKN